MNKSMIAEKKFSPEFRPQRLQRTRTAGSKLPPEAVYVGRPTKWGNPFKVGTEGAETNEVAVRRYRDYLLENQLLLAEVKRVLAGKPLACWCPPSQACHADVLIEVANPGPRLPGNSVR